MKELNWESLLGIDLSPEDIEILKRQWFKAFWDLKRDEIIKEAWNQLLNDNSGDVVVYLEPLIPDLIKSENLNGTEVYRDKSRDD